MQETFFSISVGATWRMFTLRDRLLGRIGKSASASTPGVRISRHLIHSSNRLLDAVLAEPADPPRAALLICHGIGEIVEHWLAAQDLLAANGIASLVFDYAGYGRSRGRLNWRHCEDDAVSAFTFLNTIVPGTPISVLGFSMGSGIATAILPSIPAARLFLCSAFTSFRDAACVLGLPRFLAPALPRIWCNSEALPGLSVPVSIVHCDRDRAFPVRMASELSSACGIHSELILVPNQAHNEAFYRPQMSYWTHIIHRMIPLPAGIPASRHEN
jgi:alpha-beta hydrolase superfamily lysophospholipase